ncbi:MAG: universal stress protein [Armatimonadota bacterium]|nr:universal stress protein [Armatimonadota bacterium]
MFAKVLAPTDFAPWSDAALALLRPLYALGTREVTLLHVVDPRPYFPWTDFVADADRRLESEAWRELDARRATLADLDWNVRTRVRHGVPVEEIVRAAIEEQAELILMGSRRTTFLRQVVLGSVSENVIRHAPVPVLLGKWWPDAPPPERGGPFEHVLLPTDFSPCAEKAFRCLVGLAGGGLRRAILLHVQDVRLPGSAEFNTDGRGLDVGVLEEIADGDRLAAWQKELERLGVEVRVLVREGLPYREILRTSEEHHVSAIVLGSHGKSSMAEILLGSVSGEVVRQARVPTLVVRRDLDGEPA